MYRLLRITSDDGTHAADTPALYFDAYGFGDRALEGLVMKVTLEGDKLTAAFAEKDPKLPRYMNKDAILQDALDYALQRDVFSTTPELDDDDGVLWDETKPASAQESSWQNAPIIENGRPLMEPEAAQKTTQNAPKPIAVLSIKSLFEPL